MTLTKCAVITYLLLLSSRYFLVFTLIKLAFNMTGSDPNTCSSVSKVITFPLWHHHSLFARNKVTRRVHTPTTFRAQMRLQFVTPQPQPNNQLAMNAAFGLAALQTPQNSSSNPAASGTSGAAVAPRGPSERAPERSGCCRSHRDLGAAAPGATETSELRLL